MTELLNLDDALDAVSVYDPIHREQDK